MRQFGAAPNGVIVEDYWIVVPSTLTAEQGLLQVGLARFAPETRTLEIEPVTELIELQISLDRFNLFFPEKRSLIISATKI